MEVEVPMSNNLGRIKVPALVLSILFLLSACLCLVAQQQTSTEAESLGRRTHRDFFVLNSPSTESAGFDSILAFDSLGHSSVFFRASHKLVELNDIACSSSGRPRFVVAQTDFAANISELLELNASGRIVSRIPFGSPSGAGIALAFDDAGNFYAAQSTTLYKNGVVFTNLIPAGSEAGKLVADRKGILYLSQPITSNVVRIDTLGHVAVFADATKGVNAPYGLAVDWDDNLYVANNPPSAPAFIQKFNPSGVPSSFAAGISSQPNIRGMTFDLKRDGRIDERDRDLYATLGAENEILKFDTTGISSLFANATDGLDFPLSIVKCRH
jgi:hypothetical protein